MKDRKPLWTAFQRAEPEFDPAGGQIYVNSRYQVSIRGKFEGGPPYGQFCELSLKRRDKEPIYDWRDMQKIKNEFFGANATMLQVFPPEKHLVDTSNQYYFYVFWEYEFPFGFKERLVSERTGQQIFTGVAHSNQNKQQPFEAHQIPETVEEDQAHFDREYAKLQASGWPPDLTRSD